MKISNTIRSLFWKQPFASLMLEGKIETRTWSTEYRGQVLICASKAPYSYDACVDKLNVTDRFLYVAKPYKDISNKVYKSAASQIFNRKMVLEYPFNQHGVAIAIGTLKDCYPMRHEDEFEAYIKYGNYIFIKPKRVGLINI